jgi:hypothetical protein
MNERILKLAVEAGVTGYFAAGTEYATPIPLSDEVQKFAELIVRECADIIENSRIEGDEGVCLVGATKCKIKQNFGVE